MATPPELSSSGAPYASLSLWLDQVDARRRRPALDGDVDVDVAIVGGGYTALWTAWYLLDRDPTLRVIIVEREIVGFGASGRNGGWCVGEIAGGYHVARRIGDHEGAVRLVRAGMDTVDEVGRVVALEGIDCGFHKGGTIRVARNRAQLDAQREEVEHDHGLGFVDDIRLLNADEAAERCNATDVLGGIFWAPCARIHPAQLVQGLAAAVERKGARIVEGTAALALGDGAVETSHGRVRADIIVRATEGFTREIDGFERDLLPLYSLMVATEPLSPAMWERIGLGDCETFADDRHMVIYGQRTRDDRIAFGGRGARYGYGSRVDPAIEQDSEAHDRIVTTLTELFPVLRDVGITHRWGGVLGVPRDWFPSVGIDRDTGMAWGGGYVGEGVAISNLHGRTLADLINGIDSPVTDLLWVNRQRRRWEREPFRWLGVNGSLGLMERADRYQDTSGNPSQLARIVNALRS